MAAPAPQAMDHQDFAGMGTRTDYGAKCNLWLRRERQFLRQRRDDDREDRPSFGLMKVEIMIDDLKNYTMPWIDQLLVFDSELLDSYCLENETDFVHRSGR